ncbi:MAG: response regulator [Gammaproteobacteria bacterium]
MITTQATHAEPAAGQARPTIVVIDASAASISLYERSVKSLGVALAVFESSQTSLAYLKHNPADLIFLELMVPGQDGLSLLRELRAGDHHARTPVIVVTSKDYLQDRNQAQALGVKDFLAKPLRSQEIRNLIERHVQGASGASGDGPHAKA